MSRSNSLLEKQVRRLEKSLRDDLPAAVDLIDYLTTRKLARNKREARELCLAGRVKVESHTVGRLEVKDVTAPGGKRWVLFPFVPAMSRGYITVTK